jgi:hypothetical protein
MLHRKFHAVNRVSESETDYGMVSCEKGNAITAIINLTKVQIYVFLLCISEDERMCFALFVIRIFRERYFSPCNQTGFYIVIIKKCLK